MNENNQKRKILVSEKTYEKISDALKDKLVVEGVEIEVLSDAEFKSRVKKEQKDVYVFKDEENLENMVLDFKMPHDYEHSYKEFPVKKPKMYVPRTIGKPINKKKGGR